MILEIDQVTMKFGGLTVLDKISFNVEENTIHGVIGPNGSGKTTLFNVISRIYNPSEGEIRFEGQNIIPLKSHQLAPLGLARTFQLLRVFPSMTVLENLMLAMTPKEQTTIFDDFFATSRNKKQEQEMREQAYDILKMIGLERKANNPTDGISIGQRRMLQLGLAVISKPKLLLLDECVAGLDPENVERLVRLLLYFQKELNITILMVEHIMDVVLRVCNKITALDYGRLICEGEPEEVVGNAEVIEAYLGKA